MKTNETDELNRSNSKRDFKLIQVKVYQFNFKI